MPEMEPEGFWAGFRCAQLSWNAEEAGTAQAGLLWSLTMSQVENVFRCPSWDCDFCPNASQQRSRVWTERLKEAHLQGLGQVDLP